MILASDYDGTLKINGHVSEKDISAINKFQKAGHLFGIVTGRSIKMIVPELKEVGISYDFLIGNNGGILADAEGNVLNRKDIRFEDALELIEDLKNASIMMYGISDGDDFGTIHPKSTGRNKFNAYASDPDELLARKRINSFYFRHFTDEQTLQLYQSLTEKFKGRIAFHYNNGTIDASAPFIDKATGIRMVEEAYGIKPYVIGDGHNDLPMIHAYQGFSLAHAHEEVKKQATVIVVSVCECIEMLMKTEKCHLY